MIRLALVYNLRSGISKKTDSKSIGLINLQRRHLYFGAGNLVTLVFRRKHKVVINRTHSLDQNLYSYLKALIKGKEANEFLFLRLNDTDFNRNVSISLNLYFREITEKASVRFKDIKQMNTNIIFYKHLKIMYKQNFPQTILVTKTQRLLAYLSVINDHILK